MCWFTVAVFCAEETENGLRFDAVEMKPGAVYNIPQNLWHNAITGKDAKLIVIEDVSTGMSNSEILQLNEEQITLVRGFWK